MFRSLVWRTSKVPLSLLRLKTPKRSRRQRDTLLQKLLGTELSECIGSCKVVGGDIKTSGPKLLHSYMDGATTLKFVLPSSSFQDVLQSCSKMLGFVIDALQI